MNCRYCAYEVNQDAIACLKCGCDPLKGNKHCNGCGVETNPEQIMCIKCGISLKTAGDGKLIAVVSYLTIIGFIISLVQHSSNKTSLGAYHLRQSLGFMILSLITTLVLGSVSSDGEILALLLLAASFVLLWDGISGFINAINGKQEPCAWFGTYYEKVFSKLFI